MQYAFSSGGLMVHDHEEWPCAICRPEQITDSRGYCMCVHCAHRLMTAAGAGAEDARALLDDVTEALAILERQVLASTLVVN